MKKIIALTLAATLALGLTACKQNVTPTPTTVTNPTTPPEVEELYKIDSYTGTADAVIANKDTIVATLGDTQLRNSTLQLYYWLDVYDYLSNYGTNGLDLSKSLHEQKLGDYGTWQHAFLGSALTGWQYYESLSMVAREENTTLLPFFQKQMDNLDEELRKSAEKNHFTTVEEMILHDVGPGCSVEDFRLQRLALYTAQSYTHNLINNMSFTDAQLEACFTEYEAQLSVEGVTKSSGDTHQVRHILLQMDDDITEPTDADWNTLHAKAQALLDQWLNGEATEDTFAQLAMEHSEDPGSVNSGGLYSGLTKNTSFLDPFKQWYLEEGRKSGDYCLIKTTAGYHLMYYVGTEPMWTYYSRELLISDTLKEIETAAMEKYPLVIHYDKIMLGEVSLLDEK